MWEGMGCIPGDWVFPKIMVFPPKSSISNRIFHYFHHLFWGKHPYFWKHPDETVNGSMDKETHLGKHFWMWSFSTRWLDGRNGTWDGTDGNGRWNRQWKWIRTNLENISGCFFFPGDWLVVYSVFTCLPENDRVSMKTIFCSKGLIKKAPQVPPTQGAFFKANRPLKLSQFGRSLKKTPFKKG